MPLYEDAHNAQNRIDISQEARASIVMGTQAVIEEIARRICAQGAPCRVAIDMWYGVDFAAIGAWLQEALGQEAQVIASQVMYRTPEEIAAYKQPFLTDDPGFGWVNSGGTLQDLIDPEKLHGVAECLADASVTTVVLGPGALMEGLSYDLVFYAEKTRQRLLWQMWDGALVPFGQSTPAPDYHWKEFYYCDYYLLDRQKKACIDRMDAYIEANDSAALKLVPRAAYEEILETLVQYPVKEIKIFQPGPWGAYRYRDLFDVPGLACNAWNELAGPELGMMIDIGREDTLTLPFVSLFRHAEAFVGPYLNRTYPGLFPLDVWLDDGFFDKPTPPERTAMPIHNHPSTDYVGRHFNEPLGRYETYYICEAYEGANTLLGYSEDADMEQWERACRASNNLTPIENWKDYLCRWDANVGDLFLIPPGTAHAHGGNQMVLEMDTCPSIAGTEYSFFTYDYARNSWDDRTKTMTGKPCKMHLEHSFDSDKFRRRDWVQSHLLAKPKVVKWTRLYQMDRYASVSEMPFEIERFHFTEAAQNDTEGRFLHVLTLTIGTRVKVVSKANPDRYTEIERFQSCVVPAGFGAYEIFSMDGGFSTVVQLRWKEG